MKKILFIVFMSVLLSSCKKVTSYRMQMLIKNESNSKQTIQLFPKSDYLKDDRDDLYMYSDLGNGDFGDKYSNIEKGESNSIFISSEYKLEPHELALRVFDSIFIIPLNENKTVMKFYPDSVSGYSENLFNENSIWLYELRNYDEPDNFNQNPVKSHDYSFLISTDKY